MRLVPTGIWDKLKAGGFKVHAAQKELGLVPLPAHAEILPLRYQYLAIEAVDRDLITEGRLARFLNIDRLEARQLAEVLRGQADELDDTLSTGLDLSQPLDAQENRS